MEVLKEKKYLGIAGLALLFLGVILPFFKIEILGVSEGISLLKYWEGYVIIVSVASAALIIFKDELKDKIPQLYKSNVGNNIDKYGIKALLGPIAIAVLVVIYTCVSVRKSLAGGSSYVNLNDYVKYGLGFYSAIIGLVCLTVYTFIYKGGQAPAQPQNFNGGEPAAWQPQQQPMQQPMQQDQNMMNQQFAQPQQPMQQNYQQPMQQDPNMMNNNQFPNNNQF